MRAVVQRVSRASVTVDEARVAAIGTGLLALVGVGEGDGPGDADWLANKLAGLRVFPDEDGRMSRSVQDVGGSVLVVSQFTLYGDVTRGRRPSFVTAADPDVAEPLVERVAAGIATVGVGVATGAFGARMEIDLVNDGPVTLIVDTSG